MMSPEAKRWLSKTVRQLRERLLVDLRGEVDGQYKWQLPLNQAILNQEERKKRQRLDNWLTEQVRGCTRGLKENEEQARERHLQGAVKLAGATLLNRLVVVRQLETLGLSRVKLVTRGWDSSDYKDFREFAPAIRADEGEGFSLLLSLLFDELALDLPGLFGEVGVTGLIPVSTATLRHTIETLEAKDLSEQDRQGLWHDDTLLGWVYQFWNDPELDELRARKGKIQLHELAAKTQLFTDKYIVDWILQNSLGHLWLNICAVNGWTPEVVSSGTLDTLEGRRKEWRAKRADGQVSMEALLPVGDGFETNWKYWVPRTVPHEPESRRSIREVRILDPACGSGHFLVTAFELLCALYEEEARHRSESWSRQQIARWILESNLHGIDIDPRAVQMAEAALWLKAARFAAEVEDLKMNIVSSQIEIADFDEQLLTSFTERLEQDLGINPKSTQTILLSLHQAQHLGTLLRLNLTKLVADTMVSTSLLLDGIRPTVFATREQFLHHFLEQLNELLASEVSGDEVLFKVRGQQLASGIRFVDLNQRDRYDLVVGNPPYLQASDIDGLTLDRIYPEAKSDLFGAFLLRALELCRPGGLSALITMRSWMFIKSFSGLRKKLLEANDLHLLGDLNHGCFDTIPGVHVATVMSVFRKKRRPEAPAVAVMPTPLSDYQQDNRRTFRKMAALLAGEGRHEFQSELMTEVPEQPIIYWWSEVFLAEYARRPKIADVSPARFGANTGDNGRFLRLPWEVDTKTIEILNFTQSAKSTGHWWPYIKGAEGHVWLEPLRHVVNGSDRLLELNQFAYVSAGLALRNPDFYFLPGVAFSMIGCGFNSRAHRYRSIFGGKGSSVFPEDVPNTLCLMNSAKAKYVLTSLNPGIGFEVGDVNRLPLFPIESADQIVANLDVAFTQHEQARETSVEFLKPGPSAWSYAQQWAQQAVDREAGAPLPPYQPEEHPPTASDQVSYALGLALGRFPAETDPLPHGILFLAERSDSLDHPAAQALHAAWAEFPLSKLELRDYLKGKFFSEDHLKRYEKRPIYFPLSSEKKNFVAYVSIHRWQDNTLDILLADHLQPELSRLAGELNDLGEARTQGERKAQAEAQARYQQVSALAAELQTFVDTLRAVAERGAPPGDAKGRARQLDAPFRMDLDDGVMINSAGLWPLLAPQWKDPKEWWKELCADKGVYDWAHLTMRYFPERVTARCQQDPSLAVAHGLFWTFHPDKAMEWELRLQDPEELGPDFHLDEVGSHELRAAFQAQHPDRVRELRLAEEKRRAKKADKAGPQDQGELDFEEAE